MEWRGLAGIPGRPAFYNSFLRVVGGIFNPVRICAANRVRRKFYLVISCETIGNGSQTGAAKEQEHPTVFIHMPHWDWLVGMVSKELNANVIFRGSRIRCADDDGSRFLPVDSPSSDFVVQDNIVVGQRNGPHEKLTVLVTFSIYKAVSERVFISKYVSSV